MQTNLHPDILATDRGAHADEILRACVHCGFCNATCPTYQLLGDELDGPRGRIYLIKNMLETGSATREMRLHLDRCLTCRACETTCPSGVRYGELLEIGREVLEETCPRPPLQRGARWLLNEVVQRPALFAAAIGIGQTLSALLPGALASKVPARVPALAWPKPVHDRRVLILTGCAQAAATPDVNHALAQLLDAHGISAVPADGCCGALPEHMTAVDSAARMLATNVRGWGALVAAGSGAGAGEAARDAAQTGVAGPPEAIISTASGCGVHVKAYGRLVKDAALSAAAARIAELTVDVAEFIASLPPLRSSQPRRVAWHAPCTLQHGQRVTGVVERLLRAAGHELVPVADAQLCCGSAGTYSVLQPVLAQALGTRKLAALSAGRPDVIATANVGCQLHLGAIQRHVAAHDQPASLAPTGRAVPALPVLHWLQLLS